jgi:hypothetical protein
MTRTTAAWTTFAALTLAAFPISDAAAGGCKGGGLFGLGHGGHARECYQHVTTPDVYQIVARQVVVQPPRQHVVNTPAVMGTQAYKYEISPGRWQAEQIPAQYATQTRQVMVSPARTVYETIPAQYQTVTRDVVVQPASYRWERRSAGAAVVGHGGVVAVQGGQVAGHAKPMKLGFGHHGHKHHGHHGFHGGYSYSGGGATGDVICKVYVPAVTRTVTQQVVVSPARQIARVIPAEYRTVTQNVLISPARVRHSYVPPVYGWGQRQVVIRPASSHVVTQPAIMGVAYDRVLVQRGHSSWQQVGGWHGGGGYAAQPVVHAPVMRAAPAASYSDPDDEAPAAAPARPAK